MAGMLFDLFSLIWIALIGTATCQSSTTTSSAPAATHTISVGADGLNFSPNQVFANKGDIIEYRFYPQNHSVARAAFGNEPCIPYELTGPGRVGFWSDFHPVALVLSNNATLDFSPGEYFPKESRPSRTTTATGATFTPTPTASTLVSIAAEPTATPVLAPSHHSNGSRPSLGAGPIAGIVIGAVAVVALASALFYMCGRRQSVKKILQHQAAAQPPNHNSYQPTISGISEVQYPNMQKIPVVAERRWAGTETESYRSLSPPADERTGMMQTGRMTPQGHPSPPVGAPMFQPTPAYYSSQDRDNAHASAGLRPYTPAPKQTSNELHELASPDETRPFSYTDSESGYVRPADRDGHTGKS
ncbi:hypothetical protein IFR05_004133 [Cadophora sp. M221]|nr:hypothetical protein IFR05_004133 [Cadophora sp. M221]